MRISPTVTYGLLIFCGLLFLAGFVLPTQRLTTRWPKLSRFMWLFQLAALGGIYFVLRPGATTGNLSSIQASIAKGEPVLLDFYSNY